MSDPKRWILDDAGSTREERDLLRTAAEEDIDPPAWSEAAVWAALVTKIGPGGGGGGDCGSGGGGDGSSGGAPQPPANAGAAGQAAGGGSTAGGSAASGSAVGGASSGGALASGGVIKAMIVGAASACVVIAAYATFGPDDPAPSDTSSSSGVPTARAPITSPASASDSDKTPSTSALSGGSSTSSSPSKSAPGGERALVDPPVDRPSAQKSSSSSSSQETEAEADPTPAPAAADTEAPSGAASITPTERASRLREESRLLSEARDALRRGDSSGALRKLDEARTRFPGGVLAQEREALTIEALYRGGQRAAAASLAASFLRAYPNSPHATRIQGFSR